MPVLTQAIVNGILLGGIYMLVSVGLTLVFGVTRILNFAHGEFLMLAMYLVFGFSTYLGINVYVGVIPAAAIIFFFGIVVFRLLLNPVLHAPASMQVLATVGLSIAIQNIVLATFGGDYLSLKTNYATRVIHLGGVVFSVAHFIAFLAAVVATFSLGGFLKWSKVGRSVRAVAQDRFAAEVVGIDVRKIYLLSFGIGSATAGMAGGLLLPIYYAFPTVGQLFVLIAFVVVVLGGMGSVAGAAAGGLLVGIVEAVSSLFLPTELKELVYFVVFLFILWARPGGLFGAAGAAEVGLHQ